MMFGFNMPQQQAPWAGLPTAQAPWNPAQSAPWRLTPWQTQGMPSGAPIGSQQAYPQLPMLLQQPQQAYLSQGPSTQIPGFDPMIPGGGFGTQGTRPQQAQPREDNIDYSQFRNIVQPSGQVEGVYQGRQQDFPETGAPAARYRMTPGGAVWLGSIPRERERQLLNPLSWMMNSEG